MDELPLVLLGLRSVPKDDLGCAPSELVYGTTIHLPGEFFEASTTKDVPAASNLLTQLRNTMATLRPKQTSHHGQQTSHVPVELQDCTFVFVRQDAHRTPLQCTYDGPFRVLERAAKYFTLDLHGKCDTVSVERLKPDLWMPVGAHVRNQYLHPPTRTPLVTPSTPSMPVKNASTPPPCSPPKKYPTSSTNQESPLRIVKRSRSGRVIKLHVKLQ